MPPKSRLSRAPCQICDESEFKYSCPNCMVLYCSVVCFKKHKKSSCRRQSASTNDAVTNNPPEGLLDASNPAEMRPSEPNTQTDEEPLPESKPLRPLTDLKWPYIPDTSAYPDPLKRDDPKPLQLSQYESVATSPDIRRILATHPRLPELLTNLDAIRGPDREDELQRALGVGRSGTFGSASTAYAEEDMRALRALAEAVEGAVRGSGGGTLGLDWGDE